MCYGASRFVKVVYCVLGRCAVCYGVGLFVMVVYCMLGRCTVY